jgi:hypothetical protein
MQAAVAECGVDVDEGVGGATSRSSSDEDAFRSARLWLLPPYVVRANIDREQAAKEGGVASTLHKPGKGAQGHYFSSRSSCAPVLQCQPKFQLQST